MKFKIYITLFLLQLVFSYNSFGQTSINQLTQLPYGEVFTESAEKIKKIFPGKAEVWKGDFFNAYRIKADNIAVDYFGNGDFVAQYSKDTLVSARIEFNFESPDTANFTRLLNTLLSEFSINSSLKHLSKYGELNVNEIVSYITDHCKINSHKSSLNYKPIKTKFLGQTFWSVYKEGNYTGNFIRVYVELIETHNSSIISGVERRYDGGLAVLVLEIKSEKLQNLSNRLEEQKVSNYTLLNN